MLNRVLACVLLSLLCGLPVYRSWSGPYAVTRHSVGPGGTLCTGDTYQVTASVGRADVGQSTNSNFLTGSGFWADLSGALPLLHIEWADPDIVLRWEDFASTFDLEEALMLKTGMWSVVPLPKQWRGDRMQVVVPGYTLGPLRFYQLEMQEAATSGEEEKANSNRRTDEENSGKSGRAEK